MTITPAPPEVKIGHRGGPRTRSGCAARISRDIDLFHDTTAAVAASWAADCQVLEAHGYQIRVEREREGFVEAVVSRGAESELVQWAADSAFRFFPLVEHEDFGLTLHAMLQEAREIVATLPPRETGTCLLDERGGLFVGDAAGLRAALAAGAVRFHAGRIRGALPQLGS